VSASFAPHATRKRLGQHFLADPGVIGRIVQAIAPRAGDCVIEIGPGEGAITWPLLALLGELTVIEFDRDLVPRLRAAAGDRGRLHVVEADVLDVDLRTLAHGPPLRLVGNLPYNISTPILFHCLHHVDLIRDMHFMLQKEVVERMAAAPGSKVYGRLSVMLQLACEVLPLFEVAPAAFRPPPKVDSAVVRLRPLEAARRHDADPALLDRVVRAAFGQRRKTLANALSAVADRAAIAAAGIDPGVRAEQLAPADYVALALAVQRGSVLPP
jgi:16S rRNA (adenine1518-N6/adenine1519-N6)-dimethyltransferase